MPASINAWMYYLLKNQSLLSINTRYLNIQWAMNMNEPVSYQVANPWRRSTRRLVMSRQVPGSPARCFGTPSDTRGAAAADLHSQNLPASRRTCCRNWNIPFASPGSPLLGFPWEQCPLFLIHPRFALHRRCQPQANTWIKPGRQSVSGVKQKNG